MPAKRRASCSTKNKSACMASTDECQWTVGKGCGALTSAKLTDGPASPKKKSRAATKKAATAKKPATAAKPKAVAKRMRKSSTTPRHAQRRSPASSLPKSVEKALTTPRTVSIPPLSLQPPSPRPSPRTAVEPTPYVLGYREWLDYVTKNKKHLFLTWDDLADRVGTTVSVYRLSPDSEGWKYNTASTPKEFFTPMKLHILAAGSNSFFKKIEAFAGTVEQDDDYGYIKAQDELDEHNRVFWLVSDKEGDYPILYNESSIPGNPYYVKLMYSDDLDDLPRVKMSFLEYQKYKTFGRNTSMSTSKMMRSCNCGQ